MGRSERTPCLHGFPRFLFRPVRSRTHLPEQRHPQDREWYQTAWKAFQRWQADAPPRSATAPVLTRADLQQFVVHLRERGIKPVSCNCWLRAMNAFSGWLHEQGVIPEPLRVRPQKLEKRVLRLHDAAALPRLLGFRPHTYVHWRVHAVVCAILDTG